MECTIQWLPASGMAFAAETGSGHLLTMDGAPDGGGRNLAPRPMETLLAGAGGCTAYDVVLILKRGRQDVTGCEVKLTAERAATEPRCIFYGFTMRDDVLFCQEAYEDAEAALAHAANVSDMLGKLLEVAELLRFEVHGPAAELAKLEGPLAGMRPTYFVWQCGLE